MHQVPTDEIKTFYEISGSSLTTTNLPAYRYFIERYVLRKSPDETQLYKDYAAAQARGQHPTKMHNIKSQEDVEIRVQNIEALFDDIRKNGIKEPIHVFIDSHGRYVVFDGHHRLACAKLLGITPLPVKVLWREAGWVEFKASLTKEYQGNFLYNPIHHPDFDEWAVLRDSARFDAIDKRIRQIPFGVERDNLSGYSVNERMSNYIVKRNDRFIRLRGLDIGSHMGYFSHEMALRGADMVAVEGYKFYHDIAVRNGIRYGSSARLVNDDVWKFLAEERREYDFILCLSFLHHYDKAQAASLIDEFRRLTKHIFCEMGDEKLLKTEDIDEILKDAKREVLHTATDGRVTIHYDLS